MMMNTKKEVMNLLEKMPEDVSIDDIMDLLELVKDIQDAEEDFKNKRISPHEHIKNKMGEDNSQGAGLSLQFNNKLENLINHDLIFKKFISQIERGLNEFIENENISFENKFIIEEDWEIPDYEKLVLLLDFKGIPFKQEIVLWKRLTAIIYDRIKSLILISSEEDTKKIKELKKKFFIKLEM